MLLASTFLVGLFTPASNAIELSGQINIEHRQFFEKGLQGQNKQQSSLVVQPEMYWQLDEGEASFTLTPFYRYDS
ncbi:MAG TPA: hypothetical protein DCS35_04615, partial [Vibrio sp.]|nr:hypothetical protein [Vibrio sp.]